MIRASYRYAINWLANNDDCYWLGDPHGSPSVAACAVMDIFGIEYIKFHRDLRRELAATFPDHEALK